VKHHFKSILALGLSITLLSASLTGCSKPQRYSGQFMDVFDTVSMTIGFEKSEEKFQKLQDAAHQSLLTNHRLFDIYDDFSGINNLKTINDNAGKQPVKVDPAIIDLLKFGKEVYTLTDGRVNIAYGAVLRLWHEKREAGIADPSHAELPDMNALKEAAKHTSIDDIVIDETNSTVFLKDPEMSLDVGGIAKGYSVEAAGQAVEKLGTDSGFLLNIGGNVKAIKKKADGSKWVVPVEDPAYKDTNSGTPYAETTYLDGMSLVTSGDYERYYVVDGKRYHHIIDPTTLMPAQYHRSVTILMKDSGLADALSTALFNMSTEDGKALIEKINNGQSNFQNTPHLSDTPIEAMWIEADGTKITTPGFTKYLKA
jgi:thiamine biosynthesis lipoprotein